jgi:hypothetical protein
VERYLNLRYDGTDVPVMTSFAGDGTADPARAFEEQYKREFGFVLEVSSCCLGCTCLPRMCISMRRVGRDLSLDANLCCYMTCLTQTMWIHRTTLGCAVAVTSRMCCSPCPRERVQKAEYSRVFKGYKCTDTAGPGHHCGRRAGAGHRAVRGAAEGRRRGQEPRCTLLPAPCKSKPFVLLT